MNLIGQRFSRTSSACSFFEASVIDNEKRWTIGTSVEFHFSATKDRNPAETHLLRD
jgi:hypothetical protein